MADAGGADEEAGGAAGLLADQAELVRAELAKVLAVGRANSTPPLSLHPPHRFGTLLAGKARADLLDWRASPAPQASPSRMLAGADVRQPCASDAAELCRVWTASLHTVRREQALPDWARLCRAIRALSRQGGGGGSGGGGGGECAEEAARLRSAVVETKLSVSDCEDKLALALRRLEVVSTPPPPPLSAGELEGRCAPLVSRAQVGRPRGEREGVETRVRRRLPGLALCAGAALVGHRAVRRRLAPQPLARARPLRARGGRTRRGRIRRSARGEWQTPRKPPSCSRRCGSARGEDRAGLAGSNVG